MTTRRANSILKWLCAVVRDGASSASIANRSWSRVAGAWRSRRSASTRAPRPGRHAAQRQTHVPYHAASVSTAAATLTRANA